MAIAQMKKIMIASHRSEAAQLLEALQGAGIVEILDAERAMVSKEWPELQVETKRPRDLEELVLSLENSISFLKEHATEKPTTSVLKPLVEVEEGKYEEVISSDKTIELLDKATEVSEKIESLKTAEENISGHLEMLLPWKGLSTPVEEIGQLETANCLAGLMPVQNFDETQERLDELGAFIETIGERGGLRACIAVCMKDKTSDTQKALRSGDFEAVSFEGLRGTTDGLIAESKAKLASTKIALEDAFKTAGELSKDVLQLEMLFDHNQNLLERERTGADVPATENTVLYEGWVQARDYKKLEKLVGSFSASSLDEIEVADGEEVPVEIFNNNAVRPFEVITRLYGMPNNKDVDPTMFLAPFFALFFGLCLTDAAYGLIMIAILWFLYKKMQGDKGFLWLFIACSAVTVVAGALTGSWCGNAIETLFGIGSRPDELRRSIMLFDPMKEPMTFFILSLGIGYFQILCGLTIAFVNNLKQKDYASAAFEQLTWLIFLNSMLVFGLSKAGMLSPILAKPCGILAIIQAVLIFLFTERKSGIAGRIGGGVFGLFSAVFYFGDILSYVRLMALGMVTAGLGMAVNILVDLLMDLPYVGWLLAAVMFIVGHLFNLAMSTLSSFVHSLRLQFVEFFPKFLEGGGKDFIPLKKKYKHVLVNTKKDN
jgi:V/A-type H+-transporting ATPase subunit I